MAVAVLRDVSATMSAKEAEMREDSAITRWFRTRAQRAELRNLPPGELERVLQETGLTAFDVDHIEADHPGPQTLLPQRLQAAGLDAAVLRDTCVGTLRDLERTCGRCGSYKQCRADLRGDNGTGTLAEYCPNTGTIEALLREKVSRQ
jgi:hypothetical protein